MDELVGQFWTLLTVVTMIVVLGILHVLASSTRNEVHLHDLRVRVNTLRRQRLEQLKDLAQNQSADIEVVDEFAEPTPVNDDKRRAA